MTQNQILLQRYQKVKTLQRYSNKKIVLFVNRNTGQHGVAKIQDSSIMKDSKVRNVLHQASFTQALQGYRGIPFMIWSGKTKQQKIVLLIEQLGDGLISRFQMCDNSFSLKTVCMLGIQMIQIIKTIHDKGFIHSNICMNIFQFGKGEKCQNLYINNFIQCMIYRDFKTMGHILQKTQYFRSPQHIFQSTAVFLNHQKSRKDDIESLFLILIYLIKGSLPWSKSFKYEEKFKSANPQFMKIFNNPKLICEGVPKTFCDLLQDCRSLKFLQQPPYHWYILKLKSVIYAMGQQHDFVYDWMLNKKYLNTQITSFIIPSLHLDKDDNFLKYLENNIFPNIDVDQIASKHQKLAIKPVSNRKQSSDLKFDPYRDKPNQEADGKAIKIIQKQQQEIEKQKQQQKKSVGSGSPSKSSNKMNQFGIIEQNGKQNMEEIENNILKRKRKNKQQCNIM